MPERDEVAPKLLKKTEQFAERLAQDTADEHDVFPALLWVLLKSDENFQSSIESLNRARLDDREFMKLSVESAALAIKSAEQSLRELLEARIKQAVEYQARKSQENFEQIFVKLRNILWAVGLTGCIAAIAIALILFQLTRT